MEVKTYTLQKYASEVANCHPNTVISRIAKGLMPSNHKVLLGKQYIITVYPPSGKDFSTNTELAITEFSKLIKVVQKDTAEQLQFKREIAAELCVKYDIKTSKLFKILNL